MVKKLLILGLLVLGACSNTPNCDIYRESQMIAKSSSGYTIQKQIICIFDGSKKQEVHGGESS